MPGLRSVLLVLTGVAAILARGRRRARSDSTGIRRWRAGRDALRRRPLRSPRGDSRRVNVVRCLRAAARRLSSLFAGRRRLPNGPASLQPV